ncbi:PREDICTED: uncharacterized protein LOC106815983 [Priapulus caudatus]|uniref:Uncharacterized protein LOC106815983 n=1 Tax=Priapulus caudatus TaxID=37621 RepID=A0ABM1EUY2_PRICU|nr:PREDICTED: uncharacterized protein LOC106815983 [Priapulus caudatus]
MDNLADFPLPVWSVDFSTDIPPLEDVPAVADWLSTRTRSLNIKKGDRDKVDTTTNKYDAQSQTASAAKKQMPSSSKKKCEKDTFGGLPKGFLNSKKQTRTNTGIKCLNAQTPCAKKSPLLIAEVQEALKDDQPPSSNAWMTDNLLSWIEKNPCLAKKMKDPRISNAMTMFQTNPKQAMAKYANDKEMQNFFQQFSAVLGDHFQSLAREQDLQNNSTLRYKGADNVCGIVPHDPMRPSAEEEEQMKRILAMEDVAEILRDPRIGKLFEIIRASGSQDFRRVLQASPPDIQKKLHRLIEVGLFNVSS